MYVEKIDSRAFVIVLIFLFHILFFLSKVISKYSISEFDAINNGLFTNVQTLNKRSFFRHTEISSNKYEIIFYKKKKNPASFLSYKKINS